MVNLTVLQERILRILFKNVGKPLNQRQIATRLSVSQPAIMKALPYLQKKELISTIKDMETKRWSIELNNSKAATQLKRADNLKQIYESGLFQHLENLFPGTTIILFGSYSKGEDTILSDIDIAIIGSKPKNLSLNKYESFLERKININFFDSFRKIHEKLKESLFNGIVLAGSVSLD